jgi:putative ABC transport system permease protein
MFWRLLRQSFLQGARRKILSGLTVALAATLGMALATLSVGVGDKMAQEMRAYGANIRVVPKGESLSLAVGGLDLNPLKGRETLAEADLPLIKDIFWHNNIIGLSPFLDVQVSLGDKGKARLIGTWFQHDMPMPDGDVFAAGVRTVAAHWQVEGAWPGENAEDQVLLGKSLARRLGLGIGASLSLDAHPVRVVGLLETGGDEDSAIIGPLALAQAIANVPGRVRAIEVSALTVPETELSLRARHNSDALTTAEYDVWYCTAYVSTIAHQIEEAVVNASARPIWQVAAGEGAVIGKMQVLMAVVTLAAFLSAAMGVSALMTATVVERAREIGLMKALGASLAEINAQFLSEAAAIGAAGGLLGCGFGALLSQGISAMVFGQSVPVPWIAVPLVTVAAIVVALAGAAYPARTIARLAPVEVLYGRK